MRAALIRRAYDKYQFMDDEERSVREEHRVLYATCPNKDENVAHRHVDRDRVMYWPDEFSMVYDKSTKTLLWKRGAPLAHQALVKNPNRGKPESMADFAQRCARLGLRKCPSCYGGEAEHDPMDVSESADSSATAPYYAVVSFRPEYQDELIGPAANSIRVHLTFLGGRKQFRLVHGQEYACLIHRINDVIRDQPGRPRVSDQIHVDDYSTKERVYGAKYDARMVVPDEPLPLPPYYHLVSCSVEYTDEDTAPREDPNSEHNHKCLNVLTEFPDGEHYAQQVADMQYDTALEVFNEAIRDLPGAPYVDDVCEPYSMSYYPETLKNIKDEPVVACCRVLRSDDPRRPN